MSSEEIETTCAAIAGQRPALEKLWRRQRPWISAVLLAHAPRAASSHVDLEDLLQEVAVTLVARIADLREPTRLRPWLRKIALNVARGAGRRARTRERVKALPADAMETLANNDGDAQEARQELQRVLAVVAQLPDDYREVLLLRAVRGLTQRQLSILLEVPETTVETRLARARRLLRSKLLKRAER